MTVSAPADEACGEVVGIELFTNGPNFLWTSIWLCTALLMSDDALEYSIADEYVHRMIAIVQMTL